MKEQVFGLRRSRAVRKPLVQYSKVIFYYCGVCGSICQRAGWAETESEISCCGEETEVLVPVFNRGLGNAGSMSYRIVNDYNGNVVQVSFHMEEGYELEWLYLRTFTGGYMKYIMPGKRPPCVSTPADEDAFSYCDEGPCLECTFWCERGFMAYDYMKGLGLVEVSLDQISPY